MTISFLQALTIIILVIILRLNLTHSTMSMLKKKLYSIIYIANVWYNSKHWRLRIYTFLIIQFLLFLVACIFTNLYIFPWNNFIWLLFLFLFLMSCLIWTPFKWHTFRVKIPLPLFLCWIHISVEIFISNLGDDTNLF